MRTPHLVGGPTGFYGHLGVGMRKPHTILGSYGREMCVATRAIGPRAGLFGPRLRRIEWETLFYRKHSWVEFLGLDHLEKLNFRFPVH